MLTLYMIYVGKFFSFKLLFFRECSHFKSYEKYFLFYLKRPFRSSDIQFFVILFPSFPQFPDLKSQIDETGI